MTVRFINNSSAGRNEDTDLSLSELTENSLMISKTQEITKFNTNNVLTNTDNGGIYYNGLSTMTSAASAEDESSQDSIFNAESSSGPLGASSSLALPQADVGLLAASFPDSWNDWESKRRAELIGHQDKFSWKKHHTKQLRNLKRIRRKTLKTKKVVSFHHRRLRLERSIGRHLKAGCIKCPNDEETEVVPFQSSKSLRRRQRRRVVRFVDDEITEWKREKSQTGFGRGMSVATMKTPFLEAERERKNSQRALMDLQVGMKCMGL